jgi:hypothetical protein
MGMSDERIERLSKRFSTHAVGRPSRSNRARARHTFYLDTDLVNRLDRLYQEVNHELYPKRISKSVFLETLIEHGVEHIADLKTKFVQVAQTPEATET